MAKQKRVRLRLGKPDRSHVRKVSFLLSAETDIRVTIMAASRRVDRSAWVEETLAEATRGLVVELPDVRAG
jgi:hypothetical protein